MDRPDGNGDAPGKAASPKNIPNKTSNVDAIARKTPVSPPRTDPPIIPDPRRIYHVIPENRVFVVTPENRVLKIAPENRVYVVVPENRVFVVNPEDRTYVVETERFEVTPASERIVTIKGGGR